MLKHWLGLGVLSVGLVAVHSAGAQAPAGAPAGAGGICKDGTYSMQATKAGACRGHKGVQTWYLAEAAPAPKAAAAAAAPVKSMPAPTPMSAPAAAMPAPKPAAAPMPAAPAPTAAAAAAAPAKKGPGATAASKPQAAGGGPGLVWVNTASNVYHCNGDEFYGRTKAGAYMSEADAKAKGAHGAKGGNCAGK